MQVRVENGWVALEGDVDDYHQREAAERGAQRPRHHEVENERTVDPTIPAAV